MPCLLPYRRTAIAKGFTATDMWHRGIIGVFFLAMLCLPVGLLRAEAGNTIDEDQVRTHILLNFPQVITWPDSPYQVKDKTVICALSDHMLARRVKETIETPGYHQPIIFKGNIAQEQARHCHILLLGEREESGMDNILASVLPYPVLTISTTRNFILKGGMIGFVKTAKTIGLFSEQQVSFEVNLRRTRQVGLVIDPLLLELAERILTGEARQ